MHRPTFFSVFLTHQRRIALLLFALLLCPAGVHLYAQTVAATPVPIELDPNDPMASKEERIRRQRIMIQKRIEERRMREQTKKETPQPTATPSPSGQTAASAASNPNTNRLGMPMPGNTRPTPPGPPKAGGDKGKEKSPLDIADRANAPYVTFFLTPASTTVQAGEKFTTDCRLLNPGHLAIDAVDVLLDYPEANLKAVAVHQNELLPNLEGQPELLLDDKAGTLIYRAHLKKPLNAEEMPLIKVVWKSTTPTQSTQILPGIAGQYSTAYSKDKRLTRSVLGEEAALSGAKVRILPPLNAVPQGDMILSPLLTDRQLRLAGFKSQSSLKPPTLWIDQPKTGTLQPGQWLTVDFGLDNPERLVFDEVRLAARFDPEAIEVVDADRGNWIGEGVNLLDGPFHETWFWDLHYRNAVSQASGLLYYRMGTTNLREQPSGALARAFVRIKKPTQAPLFTWVMANAPLPNQPSTGVYLFGQNLYRSERDSQLKAEQIRPGNGLPASLASGGERADPASYRF